MGAKASSFVCVSESTPVYFAFLPLLCNLGASQCPGSYTHGGCHQRQLLHSPLAQDISLSFSPAFGGLARRSEAAAYGENMRTQSIVREQT
jgi:hypothetical protein